LRSSAIARRPLDSVSRSAPIWDADQLSFAKTPSGKPSG
jgi:hypothetical protein